MVRRPLTNAWLAKKSSGSIGRTLIANLVNRDRSGKAKSHPVLDRVFGGPGFVAPEPVGHFQCRVRGTVQMMERRNS